MFPLENFAQKSYPIDYEMKGYDPNIKTIHQNIALMGSNEGGKH
jgi:hypothetical protein